jgi:hypothetical protein
MTSASVRESARELTHLVLEVSLSPASAVIELKLFLAEVDIRTEA